MTWMAQHETGSIIEIKPKDSRGVELMIGCGYKQVDCQDGMGWRPIAVIQTEVWLSEEIGQAA